MAISSDSVKQDASLSLEQIPAYAELDWDGTTLGSPKKWAAALHTAACMIVNLPHPAAIYWATDLVLLSNKPWHQIAETGDQQGRSQSTRLSDEAAETLSVIQKNKTCIVVKPAMLLENAPLGHQLLLAPIVGYSGSDDHGTLVQLLPSVKSSTTDAGTTDSEPQLNGHQSSRSPSPKDSVDSKSKKENTSSKSSSDVEDSPPVSNISLDDFPLDDHPFFKRFADLVPAGIAILDHKAEAVYVNQLFWDLTTHADDDRSFKAWPHSIHPEDYDRVMGAYNKAFENQEPLRQEFRGHRDLDIWRLLLLNPLKEDNLKQQSLKEYGGFICAIVDITPNKRAELQERRAAQEATERKQQQERFIDLISHEIRNPLSAVLHCAEEIQDVVSTDGSSLTKDAKESILEAADTISLCVAHQKNIVDDVLAFSKLDARMLSLSPKDVQPKRQLADSLKMHVLEFRKYSIKFEYKCDISYKDTNVDWVKADLVRVAQILVNLISNAIKFTAKKEGKKEITVGIGASLERPSSYPPNVVFFDTENLGYTMDGTKTQEWGNGESLYIMVAVMDTGIGISDANQAKLFQRFRQATPKTEETYGGSGLGLNISRKICHLHGGEIGVSSKEGEGSTFGFFFRVRRSEDPPRDDNGDGESTLKSDQLTDYVENFDISASKDDIAEVVTPPSLKNPKVEKIKAAHPDASKSSKYDHTAKIAAEVDEHLPDEYGLKGKPSESRSASDPSNRPERADKSFKMPERPKAVTQASGSARSDAEKEAVRVLLVEDNLINQRILRKKLETKGFSITTANNGKEALDAVVSAPPSESGDSRHIRGFDIILMDQEMPVMDGNAAAKAIRKWENETREEHAAQEDTREARYHIPILGVSANVRTEQTDSMREAGMDDFLGKPFKIEEMVKMINRMTGGEPESKSIRDPTNKASK